MQLYRSTLKIFALFVFVFAFSIAAQAQASRTWVSGVGDDVNPCSRTAPCKTFAGAISKTAINGEINSADVYVSNHLFAKLWPRMLKAAAVEAVAESSRASDAPVPKPASIETFISEAEKGRAKARTTSGKSKVITKENDGSTVFEARDKADLVVHRNYVKVN